MVALHIGANAIYVEPMQTRAKENFVDTYEKVVSQMRTDGLKIKKQVLDNEASEEYKNAIKEKGIKYELVPPGQHRQNIAERAIQTFKSHLLQSYAESTMHFSCTCGADFCRRPN